MIDLHSILAYHRSKTKVGSSSRTDASEEQKNLPTTSEIPDLFFDQILPEVKLSRSAGKAHFTGYYSPILEGSRKPTAQYPYGVYLLPKKEELRTLTREEIDFEGGLANSGLALFYTASLFDLYLMYIEGSGGFHLAGDAEDKI